MAFYPNRMQGGGIMPGMPGMPQPPQMQPKPQYQPTPWQPTGPIKAPWEMALLHAGANLIAGKGIGGGVLGGLEGYLSERGYQDDQRRRAEEQQYRRHRDEVGDYQTDRTFERGVYEGDRTYAAGRDDEEYNRMDRNRTFSAGRDDEMWNRGHQTRVFDRGVFESDRGYNRGILESDRSYGLQRDQYNRGILESDRSHALGVDAARRAQAQDDAARQAAIVEGNYKSADAARKARESEADIRLKGAQTTYYERGGRAGTPLDVDANDQLYFEQDAAKMLGVGSLDEAGIDPQARMAGARAYSETYQATRSHAAAVEAGMAAMKTPVGSSVGTLPGTGIFGTNFMGQTGILPPPNGAPQQPAPGTAQAATGPVQIMNDAEYDALPSGTRFVGPDGVERVKP
jgi:hypothetical protein